LPDGSEAKLDFYASATPILLAGKTELLVLADPRHPRDVLVPTAAGAPLQLTEEQLQRLRERQQAA
jgi:hypothetical protein